MKEQQARPCPLCEAMGHLNVISIYTRKRFQVHVEQNHPGIDFSVLWVFPLPNRKGAA
jgi:hypothetical protein